MIERLWWAPGIQPGSTHYTFRLRTAVDVEVGLGVAKPQCPRFCLLCGWAALERFLLCTFLCIYAEKKKKCSLKEPAA